MQYAQAKKLKIPDKPGVYFFLGPKGPARNAKHSVAGGEIFYIGKATSLRNRVASYFREDLIQTRGPVTVEMVFRAKGLKWETTSTVLEALILEANLIKKYQPYYNIKEKDNKSFNYVVITKETLPKVLIKRGRELDFEKIKGSVFGPYVSGPQLREALKIIRKIFPFLDDKSKNYFEFYRQINLAPDLNNASLYLQNIKNIQLFLSGKKKEVIRNLKKEMKVYAAERQFERAGEIKRQLFALEHINDVALLKEEQLTHDLFRLEAYDVAHLGGKSMVGVMTVVEGNQANKSEYRKFKINSQSGANDTGALTEVLERRLTHAEWRLPDLIVVDGSTAQINAARKALVRAGKLIPVVSVIKDDRHKPKAIGGDKKYAVRYEREILIANSEAHRFAIAYHKNLRGKNFLR